MRSGSKTLVPEPKPRKPLGNITNKASEIFSKKNLGQLLGLKPKAPVAASSSSTSTSAPVSTVANVLSGAQRVASIPAVAPKVPAAPIQSSSSLASSSAPPAPSVAPSLIPRPSVVSKTATEIQAVSAASGEFKSCLKVAPSKKGMLLPLASGLALARQSSKAVSICDESSSSTAVPLDSSKMDLDSTHVQEMDMDIEAPAESKQEEVKSSEVYMGSMIDSPAAKTEEHAERTYTVPIRNYVHAEEEYELDIMKHLRDTESTMHPSCTYMLKQPDINPKMREVLVDWLVEVHLSFKLNQETLFLAINLLDRFLEQRAVTRNKLQLVGCTALLIAAKYEEMRVPEIRDFAYMTDNAYTPEQIVFMESALLSALGFHITAPSSVRFAQRYLKAVNNNPQLTMLTNYMMEMSLPHYHMLKYKPSVISAASMLLAIKFTSNSWTPMMETFTDYKEADITDCAKDIYRIFKNLPSTSNKSVAVRKKYSLPNYGAVAKLKLPVLDM